MNYLSAYIIKRLEAQDFYSAQTDDMITDRANIAGMINRLVLILGRMDHEIQVRMEGDRATALDHPEWEIELKPSSVKYDHAILEKIWELVSDEAVMESGAYTPEHQGPMVPASWNASKAKKLKKFSGAVADVIDSARIEGRGKLSFKRKGTQDDGKL